MILGTGLLWIVSIFEGLPPLRGLWHSVCIFMAAFDTGGFTPQSQSILYYHSFPFELVVIFLMFAGTLNFGLHYNLWFGNRKEILKNIETISLFFTIMLVGFFVSLGLQQAGIYQGMMSLFRKGFFHVASAHSGTGFMTVYARQFANQWKDLAFIAIIAAMGLGGCACSTAGGIKALRVGLIFRTFIFEVKKLLLPSSAFVVEKYHHLEEMTLKTSTLRNVLIVTFSYLMVYFLGSIAGVLMGYPFMFSLFESVSSAANVGLSTGITSPSMPSFLKVVYILQMWLGRLEFISIFALFGLFIAVVRGK
ncbi:MAG: TrkH family potassium uptake protein, partial [Actinomycetia bacterium]|nr:TrkH family potassium uptake protein [Actinomycetes bacterium]